MEELKLKKEVAHVLSFHLPAYYQIMENIVNRIK